MTAPMGPERIRRDAVALILTPAYKDAVHHDHSDYRPWSTGRESGGESDVRAEQHWCPCVAIFHMNSTHVLIDLWISIRAQYSEADRREVDPPIQVEMATWTPGGQLDWWVKETGHAWSGSDGYEARTASSGGSKLVMFVAASGSQP